MYTSSTVRSKSRLVKASTLPSTKYFTLPIHHVTTTTHHYHFTPVISIYNSTAFHLLIGAFHWSVSNREEPMTFVLLKTDANTVQGWSFG